jgi:hypothetical protein
MKGLGTQTDPVQVPDLDQDISTASRIETIIKIRIAKIELTTGIKNPPPVIKLKNTIKHNTPYNV